MPVFADAVKQHDCFGLPIRVIRETVSTPLGDVIDHYLEFVVKTQYYPEHAYAYRLYPDGRPIQVMGTGQRHELLAALKEI